jgi:thiamine-phosphate pyrophosphorylase
MKEDFLLAVLTLPAMFTGEADQLEGLLDAGLPKLHVRKPGATADELTGLLDRLSPRWASRLVLHGSPELAVRYGIGQVHGAVAFRDGSGRSGGGPFLGEGYGKWEEGLGNGADGGLRGTAGSGAAGLTVSTSVHSWEELKALPGGLAYTFISPLFDSISKPGYGANGDLLRQPEKDLPCLPVGLGGVGGETIGELVRLGWRGAAVLGWIWEEPGGAVSRYKRLKKIIENSMPDER